MRDEQVKQNTTSKIITLTLRSATTGQFVTGAVAADFSGNWGIAGGTTAALSFAAGAEGDVYSSGKVCPRADGSYDWHVPDSMLTALGQVVATISVTDVIDTKVEFQVVAVDREAASYGANTVVPPAIAEFNARTLPTADYFDPAADTVARVTLVDTTTANTDMVGTDNASTHNAAAVLAEFGTGAALTALATQASVDLIDSAVATILVDTNELQTNQGNWLTATGFSTHDAAAVNSLLTSEHGSGAWTAGAGSDLSGPYTRTITVTDADTSGAIQSAKVRLYRTGETGTQLTNASGVTAFTTVAATWSYAVTATGYTGVTGTIAINADGATGITLTASAVASPTEPTLSAIEVLCLDANYAAEVGVDIDFRIVTIPSGDTDTAYTSAKKTVTSNSSGIARHEVPQGSVIEYKRGAANVWGQVTVDSDDATSVESVIGSP